MQSVLFLQETRLYTIKQKKSNLIKTLFIQEFIQELQPALNANVSSEKLLLY